MPDFTAVRTSQTDESAGVRGSKIAGPLPYLSRRHPAPFNAPTVHAHLQTIGITIHRKR